MGRSMGSLKVVLLLCNYVLGTITLLTTASLSSQSDDAASLHRFRLYLRIRTAHPHPDYASAIRFLLSQTSPLPFLHPRTLQFAPHKPLLLLSWTGSNPSLPSVLLNSHMDVVPAEADKWKHDPFEAFMEDNGDIYARGAQDTKCVGMQYLEAIRNLQQKGFRPVRTVHVSFVPDEELGGADGFGKFVKSSVFESLNVGIGLDEGLTSESGSYIVCNGERSPWQLVVTATGEPGHGSKLYDNSALENLFESIGIIIRFRASQFDLFKAGLAKEGEVISVNPVYLKAGIPTPTGFIMNVQPSEAEAGFDIRVPPFADTVALEKRITEEWAPIARNMTHKYVLKVDTGGNASITPVDLSNPWWRLLGQAVTLAGGKLADPEIRVSSSDARYARDIGIPMFGFSPIANTTNLRHGQNEYLNAKQFLKGITVYEEIIRSFSAFAEMSVS